MASLHGLLAALGKHRAWERLVCEHDEGRLLPIVRGIHPQQLGENAIAAGFEGLWVSDHFHPGERRAWTEPVRKVGDRDPGPARARISHMTDPNRIAKEAADQQRRDDLQKSQRTAQSKAQQEWARRHAMGELAAEALGRLEVRGWPDPDLVITKQQGLFRAKQTQRAGWEIAKSPAGTEGPGGLPAYLLADGSFASSNFGAIGETCDGSGSVEGQ